MKSMFLSFIIFSLLYVNLFADGCCKCCKSRTPNDTGIHSGLGKYKPGLHKDTDKFKLPHSIELHKDLEELSPYKLKSDERTDKTEPHKETDKDIKLEIKNEIVTLDGNILKQLDNNFILDHITKKVDYVTITLYEINNVYFESKISIDLKLKDNIQYIIATVKTNNDKYYLLKIIISNSGTVEKPEFKADNIFDSEYGSIVTKIIILSSSKNITSLKSIFANRKKLMYVDLSGFNTQNVTNMSNMFYNCKNLTTIDVLSSLNTQNVADMSSMFEDCIKLTNLDLSNFNTQNVTTMKDMFYGCNSLTSLNLSNLNTNNVTNMSSMFYSCNSLTSLNLSKFNTQNVINMSKIFSNCNKLGKIYITEKDNANLITYIKNNFKECKFNNEGTCITITKKNK